MQQLNYGVIGLGRISSRHIAAIDRLGDAGRLVAVADANLDKAQQAAAQHPARPAPYADYRELLEDEAVDVAVVLVPTHLHRDVSVAAMDAGKHVICEKAMAPSVAECREMIAARDRNAVKLMIAHSTRFQPKPMMARRLVEEGLIGTVTGCMAHFVAEATQPEGVPNDFWRFKSGAAGHGYVVNFGCHYIDTARYITGADLVSVSAHIGNRFSRGVIPEDHYVITADCDPDATITIAQYGSLARHGVPSSGYVIFGSEGCIEATGHGLLLSVAGEQQREIEIDQAMADGDAWDREHTGFHASIMGDTPEPVTAEDAMRNIEWAMAAYLSSERGCRVDLPLCEGDCAYRGPCLEETLPVAE
ncbi:MAG: Gfo/Idh/MocA family oxidoreductase [candidate division WS1 bacterium]|jgi:predicted dehydrogenase|nr:Gfo/Idh/MocA family oxidoreductase [candidate division WS1 bacterium]